MKENKIDRYASIYSLFPKTLIAQYLGTNNARMNRLILTPKEMSLVEIEKIATYFDVSLNEMLFLVIKM